MNGRELKMLTKPELEAIRERVEKATAGPWRMYHPQSGYYYVGNHIEDLPVCLMDGDLNQRRDDAWFIALARTDISALLQHISELETQLAEAQAQVEGLVGALEDIKQKAWAWSHTFNNQHRAEMKDIEAQCTKTISTLPADWLAQAQRREAVIRAAEKVWNQWREFRGSVPITGEMVILEAEDIQFLETVEAYQKGGA